MIDAQGASDRGPEPVALRCAALQETVALWWCSLAQPTGIADALADWLSPAELQRAARFGTATLRERYIIGRATLRRLLGRALRVPPAEVPIVRGPRGRPFLDHARALDFNVSHTGETAVFALGTGLPPHVRIGVDVEQRARRADVARLSRKVLAESERRGLAGLDDEARRFRFLAAWTCKEAMSKATGDGLRAPFGRIVVDPLDPPRVVDGPAPYLPQDWQLHRVPVPGDVILTVALYQTGSESARRAAADAPE